MIVGIDRDLARLAEGLDRERGIRSRHFNTLSFGLAVGVDSQLDRHAEEIKILLNFADHAKALLRAVDGVLRLEFRRASGVKPLHEKPGKLLARGLLRDFAEIIYGR